MSEPVFQYRAIPTPHLQGYTVTTIGDGELMPLLAKRIAEHEKAMRDGLALSMYGDTPDAPRPANRVSLAARVVEKARAWLVERLGGDPYPSDY